ncbi:ABC transporter substrate-binding protein [Cohnella terricola]|uniref:Extracellular solute-binding protein n=1 Tax=Cohnella terricola TaxID=1289167 RepID=A0A559JSX3_9BACL|nr:extracellular solute-binding protein [Cohnella terricola]TVY02979.1 extracellular solute-binding protein [Cohnella terricola]
MKKNLSLLAITAVATASLAGCGSTGNDLSSSPASASSSASEKEVTINIFHHLGEEAKRNGLKAITDMTTEKYPNIKFNIQAIDYNSYNNILKTKIAAGDAPDIVFGNPIAYRDMIKAGQILDLTGESFFQELNPSALDEMTIDGKTYGVPLDIGAMGIYYNKDIFQEQGLQIPTTFSELIKVADALQAQKIIPFAHGFKDSWTAQADFQADWYGNVSKFPDFFDKVQDGSQKFADSPEFKASVERYKKRLSYSSGDDLGTDYAKSVQMFAGGKTAMLIEGDWSISEIRKNNPQGNFGFFALPFSETASDNILGISAGDAFMASAQTKHKDEVLKFFDSMNSAEGAKAWSDHSKTISANKNFTISGADPITSDIFEYIQSSRTYSFGKAYTLTGQMDAIFRKFQETVGLDQSANVDKLISHLDTDISRLLK